MRYQDLIELKKRMEFKMTEAETLIKLIESAQIKGERIQKEMERMRNIASKLTEILIKGGWISTGEKLERTSLRYKCAVGIDGSFQLIGGVGGKWYAPISVARIVFENGFESKPGIDVFADIIEIKELENTEPNMYASLAMLSLETKAILNWGTLNKSSYVFIDGPIVDPPYYRDKDYIENRCNGIEMCLKNSSVVGCVKKIRDRFYVELLKRLIPEKSEYLNQFLSDQQLIAHVFAQIRAKGYYGPLFTKWIDVSTSNSVYELYKKEGIHIACFFFQKEVKSQILRIDVPFLEPPTENADKIDIEMAHIVKAINEWTYPGQSLPLPVFLAHNKSNIREGCAEVLYEEIMTRSRTTDPINQAILTWMR